LHDEQCDQLFSVTGRLRRRRPGHLSAAPLAIYLCHVLFSTAQNQKWQEVLGNLKNGDRVTTSGGMRVLVIALKDDAVHLRVPPDNLRLEVAKASITAINREEEEKKPS